MRLQPLQVQQQNRNACPKMEHFFPHIGLKMFFLLDTLIHGNQKKAVAPTCLNTKGSYWETLLHSFDLHRGSYFSFKRTRNTQSLTV